MKTKKRLNLKRDHPRRHWNAWFIAERRQTINNIILNLIVCNNKTYNVMLLVTDLRCNRFRPIFKQFGQFHLFVLCVSGYAVRMLTHVRPATLRFRLIIVSPNLIT